MPSKPQKVEAAWLAALGEPTRLAMIRHLATGEMTVIQLAVVCEVEMVKCPTT